MFLSRAHKRHDYNNIIQQFILDITFSYVLHYLIMKFVYRGHQIGSTSSISVILHRLINADIQWLEN
jgi:flagellar biogenesis protein FliO